VVVAVLLVVNLPAFGAVEVEDGGTGDAVRG
jgi:hypothetical protein